MTRDRLDAPTAAADKPDPARERALGGIYAFAAYFLWGFLPLYFLLLRPTGPFELVAWRILLSLAFCVILLTVLRGWGRLLAIVRQPRLLMWTALAGGLIYVNWQVFIVAALTGHMIETSLGYFMNPIVTVLLGVLRAARAPAGDAVGRVGTGGGRGRASSSSATACSRGSPSASRSRSACTASSRSASAPRSMR